VLVNRSGGGVFLEAITRYVFELAFAAPHVGDADLLEASAQLELVGLELLAATTPVDPAALAPYVGRYERQLGIHVNGDDLVLSTVFGNLRFRAVTGLPDAYLCVDKAFLGFAALFSSDEQGAVNLSIGIPNFETGALLQPLDVARLEEKRPPPRPSARTHDFRLVPVPHLTPHLNPELAPRLVPKARLPWGPR